MKKLITMAAMAVLTGSASATLDTTTTFKGRGVVTSAANYNNGAPSNANPGLINATGGAWVGAAVTDFAVRQTGGNVHDAGGSLSFRGGATGSGNKTIWEIEDARTNYDSYTSLSVSGNLSLYSERGEGHELNILSGVVSLGSFSTTATTYNKTSISIKDGLFRANTGSGTVKFNFLAGGSGEVFIGDGLATGYGGARLNFETGTAATFTVGSLAGGSSLASMNWMVDNGRVWIDGVAVTDRTSYSITQDGNATTLSVIPKPAMVGFLGFFCWQPAR